MGPYEQIIHVLNFIAPAWGVALFCVLMARFGAPAGLPLSRWGLLKQIVVSAMLGTVALGAGLFLWGVDGKMNSYAALVMVCGTTQWMMCCGWRRV